MRPLTHILASLCLLGSVAAQPAVVSKEVSKPTITAPKEFLGKQVGADHFLANYTQLHGYWQKLAGQTDRMVVEEIGRTSYGQKMVVAIISSKENLEQREEYRKISAKLARARGLDDDTARKLAAEGRAVVWIDAGMHATESVAAQNIIELVYRMVSREDQEARNIRDNVILLVCPANPDGMEMVANAYMATRKVGRIPVLYQRYIGHDNNRDFYHCSQPETTAIANVLYRRWHPQILYNHHQTAPRGTVIFTPPFRDPFNYNFDPLVVRGIELVSAHMNSRFTSEGKPGVISRTRYSTWWNGGLRTTAYFHNIIGILTESFGSPNPTPLRPRSNQRLPSGAYPDPIPAQIWHARQTIEYLQTANFAILDLAAKYRKDFLFNIYQAGRNSIRRGSQDHWTATPRLIGEAMRRRQSVQEAGDAGAAAQAERDTYHDPALRDARAYIVPADQPDFAAATRFVSSLLKTGVEVHRATKAFRAGERSYPEGSYVVLAAQAFRPHVRDMFEPQWHPNDVDATGEPVQPYDSTGWTLALQMGVKFDRVQDGIEGPFASIGLADIDKPTPGIVSSGRAGWLLQPGSSDCFKCANRLLAAGDKVFRLKEQTKAQGATFPAGTLYVVRGDGTETRLRKLADELGVDFAGVDRPAVGPALRLRPVRVGLFDRYGGNKATGWTQWLLREAEFPTKQVSGADILAGKLGAAFDVLVFHTGLPDPGGSGRVRRALRRGRPTMISDDDLEKMVDALPEFEDWSRVAERRVRLTKAPTVVALRGFLAGGGVIIALGNQPAAIAGLLDLPVRVGVLVRDKDGKERRPQRSEFFIPGSLVWMQLEKDHPMSYGAPTEVPAMFRRSTAFQVKDGSSVQTLARYPDKDLLASGWAIGADHLRNRAAIVDARVDQGHVYLFGIDAIYRGQPRGTIRLVFNAILHGRAKAVTGSLK
ncbi:MAG: M14 family metallopeptidase [Planctomycetota bacterium]